MNKLSVEQVRDMILYMAGEIIALKEELTRIDAQIGDGDHGIGMENGFSSVIDAIRNKEFSTINSLYRETGMAMLNSMGGASGVLFGSLFLQGTRGMEDLDELNPDTLAAVWANGLREVKRRGGAQRGDKTMVDALEPAVDALQSGKDGLDLAVLLGQAEQAAKEGMESTKQMTAKFGRAKSLMERALGYQDAGASSIYFLFRAMRQYVENLEEDKECIVIGCDNAAVELKEPIIAFLQERGIKIEDMGCDGAQDTTTYPKIAERVCRRILESGGRKRGILLCGTGIGMAIAANKFKGIRAAVCHDGFSTERSVLSNDCNVLCMGERVIGVELAKKNLGEWLDLKFVPGPSSAKIDDITQIESENMK